MLTYSSKVSLLSSLFTNKESKLTLPSDGLWRSLEYFHNDRTNIVVSQKNLKVTQLNKICCIVYFYTM